MKAVAKLTPVPGAALIDVKVPTPMPQEVLIRVAATSICGTDLHIYDWNKWAQGRINPPLIIGHELAGYVEEIGSEVDSFSVGDYVSAETHLYCGHCKTCCNGKPHICDNLRIIGVDCNGSFAQYLTVPENVLWKNDPSLPPEIATLQEPFGNAVHTVQTADVVGKRVVIFGDGPIGIMAVSIAKAEGAETVLLVGLSDVRLEIGLAMGADEVINARRESVAEIIKHTEVVLEMSGSPIAIKQGFNLLENGGIFIAFGLPDAPVPIDISEEIVFKEITVKGVVGREIFSTWERGQQLLQQINLAPLVTHQLPLAEYERGIKLQKNYEAVKVILLPH
ncbi:L-threonine 3-dehydrogenase [Candidatus Acetothermia bacterium]|jgi:threonine 3-dehydrogenase|nr:L-threonine 3-dehydrogenase [Candidatus Acetothermia bacterium]MCI2427760.1 L-threonine 3-dehydrogenase [Candidatus Acetothermia bacterium]MCI2429023.1 L-threonine 3-dehydrogenase [Candidatus Acetothermia bacterium]